jgi:hypothetical protein
MIPSDIKSEWMGELVLPIRDLSPGSLHTFYH